jgi:cytochrome c peroxidase
VTKAERDRGKFKTPSLRGVALTAPYMHDGSMKTLDDVVEFYNRGGNRNPHTDAALEPLNLTKEELADLVAFLKTL